MTSGSWHSGAQKERLDAEARAHLTVVTRLSPGRSEAWSRLGCKRYEGRWLTEPQIAAAKAEAQAQKDADRHWQFRIETLARHLFGPEAERARWAGEASQITDPRAVPSVWRVLVRGNTNPKYQATAVELLSQINSSLSTKRLAVLAIFGRSDQRALGQPKPSQRPARLRGGPGLRPASPVNYELQRNVTPDGTAELLVEGERFNLLRFYGPGGGPTGSAPTARTDRDPAGRSADPIASDVRAINAHNQRVRETNGPVLAILRDATGQDLGADKESWTACGPISRAIRTPGNRRPQSQPSSPTPMSGPLNSPNEHEPEPNQPQLLLKRGNAGPHCDRPAADRGTRRRRPRPDAGHDDGRIELSRSWPFSTTGLPLPIGSRSARRRSSRQIHRFCGRQGLGQRPGT